MKAKMRPAAREVDGDSKRVSRSEAFFAVFASCWADLTVGEFQAIGHRVLAQIAAVGRGHLRIVLDESGVER